MDGTITQNAKVGREFTGIFKNEYNAGGIDHLFSKTFQYNFAPPSKPGLAGFKDIGRTINTDACRWQRYMLLYDLVTNTLGGTSFVCEWMQVKGEKIAAIRVVFDARPFAAMFGTR
jgi:hypothetical protein